MNQIVTHLISVQFERGNTHLFLYTKCNSAKFFGDLGFYEIARIDGQIVFMENRKTGFSAYLERLKKESEQSEVTKRFATDNTPILSEVSSEAQKNLRIAALVMNANSFTLGHQYLVEKAAESDILHLFIVSEDQSLVPFSVRKQLVLKEPLTLTTSFTMRAVLTLSAMQLSQAISRKMPMLLWKVMRTLT